MVIVQKNVSSYQLQACILKEGRAVQPAVTRLMIERESTAEELCAVNGEDFGFVILNWNQFSLLKNELQ